MTKHSRVIAGFLSGLVAILGVAVLASFAFADDGDGRSVEGTIWVANRGAHTIRGFDAATGDEIRTVAMADKSEPGDLAYARGKLYVAEEFPPPAIVTGAQPGIAIIDPDSGAILKRIPIGPAVTTTSASWRPHHVHASRDGKLVAFGLYGTDLVAVVDTRTDTLLGTWDTNPAATNGRAHAGVFAPNGRTLYVASDATSEIVALDPRTGEIFWRLTVSGAHELAVTRKGKTAFVARRADHAVALIDLVNGTVIDPDVLTFPAAEGLPDTLRLARNDRLLTIGMRTRPARIAVVDTRTFEYEFALVGPPGEMTLAGHQWTSRNGRYTFAAFEGGSGPGVGVIDHRAGNAGLDTFPYAGRPHGVDLEPDSDDDDEEEDDD